MAGQTYHYRSDADPLDHWIKHARTKTTRILSREGSDRALAQKIKDTYGDVEKGKRGYKVASIQNGSVHLAF